MLAEWQPAIRDGRHLDVDAAMMRLTLTIVGQTLFGLDLAREADTVGKAFTAVNETTASLTSVPFAAIGLKIPFLPRTRIINQNVARLDAVVAKVIAERRQRPAESAPAESTPAGAEDLLSMLMAARDEETGAGMSDRQLRDEVMTIMLAGHETTAVALSWAFYLLSQHPDVRAALEAEIGTVLNGRLPTVDDLPALAYTTMVIEETMRLYPPAYAIARYGHEADVVGGYNVAADAVITLSPFITHRLPEFWEEPERFDPQRFTPARQAARPRYAYLPFGGGPRQCIGNSFALTEAILLLATIVQQVRLEMLPGHDMAMRPLITLRPRHGLPMMATMR
jgi:cytochrome P450